MKDQRTDRARMAELAQELHLLVNRPGVVRKREILFLLSKHATLADVMPAVPIVPGGLPAMTRAVGNAMAKWTAPQFAAKEIAHQLIQDGYGAIPGAVLDFINERPGYITAMSNTPGPDPSGDYHRWSGHAAARRQLANKLGLLTPHQPGETAAFPPDPQHEKLKAAADATPGPSAAMLAELKGEKP